MLSLRRVIRVLVLVAVVASLAAGPIQAGMGGRHGASGFQLERMLDQLDLSEDQWDMLEQLLADRRDAMEASADAMAAARETLHDQMWMELFDEMAIEDAAIAMGAIEQEQAMAQAQFLQQVRGILSLEQFAQFHDVWPYVRGCGFVRGQGSNDPGDGFGFCEGTSSGYMNHDHGMGPDNDNDNGHGGGMGDGGPRDS